MVAREIDVDQQPQILHAAFRDSMVGAGFSPHLRVKGNTYDWQCLVHVDDQFGTAKTCGFLPELHFADACSWDEMPEERRAVWRDAAARLAEHDVRLVGAAAEGMTA